MNEETKKVYIVAQMISFPDDETIQATVRDWLTLSQLTSDPLNYYINDEEALQPFNKKALLQKIKELTIEKEEDMLFSIQSTTSEFSIHIFNGNIRERLLFDSASFYQHQSIVEDYINQRMIHYGLYAYIRELSEFLAHNVESIQDREKENITFPLHPPTMYNEEKKVVVDCSQLGGYDSYYKGLCFTSCWKMWFSSYYYHFIPKQAFLDVQQVHEVEELKKDVIKITLYEKMTKWQHPTNLTHQLLFRDQLGFDQLEWSNGVGVLREPLAEFLRIGGSTQMIQYQNTHLQPIVKSQASHFTTRVFNYETNQYIEGRRYGSLNTKAYFPWQDETKKTMLAYWVLNPEYMTDRGLDAFDFYIHQYMHVERMPEDETKDYKAILRFYLPTNAMKQLPVDQLRKKLLKEKITMKRQGKETTNYRLENRIGTLEVEFVDSIELDKWAERENEKVPKTSKEPATGATGFFTKLKTYFASKKV